MHLAALAPLESPQMLTSSRSNQIKEMAIQDGQTNSNRAVSPDMPASLWASSLPDDLVRLLASRLLAADLLDYVRFRAVCANWRSSTTSPRCRGVVDPRFHPRRWMLLPEGHGIYPGHPKLQGYVRFFNLDTGTFVRVHIPLFQNHCVLDSVEGLLVLQRDDDTAIRLLNPFTGDILDLPPLSTLLPQMCQYPLGVPARQKIRYLRSISTTATFADGVVTIMLAFGDLHRVAFATPQDHQWTMSTWLYDICRAPFSHHGKTYVMGLKSVENTVNITQIDTPLPGEGLQPPKLVATCKLVGPVYMVECNSEVLVIGYGDILASKMLVYKLADLVIERYIHVTHIGEKAIFLKKRTLSVSAKLLPMVEGGTIICYNPMQYRLMQYHLSSGSWSPAMDPCSLYGTEPGPCSLIQHIFTCCDCTYWNKGLLYHWGKYSGHPWLQWPVKGNLRHGA